MDGTCTIKRNLSWYRKHNTLRLRRVHLLKSMGSRFSEILRIPETVETKPKMDVDRSARRNRSEGSCMHGWSLGSKEPALPFMLRSHSIPCFKGPRIPNAQGCCIILAAVCVSVLTPVPLSFVHNVTVNWTSQAQARAHAPSAGMVQRTKGRSASCPVRLKRQLAMSPGVRTHRPRLIKLPAPLDLSDNLSQNVILDCPSCGSRLIWVLCHFVPRLDGGARYMGWPGCAAPVSRPLPLGGSSRSGSDRSGRGISGLWAAHYGCLVAHDHLDRDFEKTA